MRDIVSRFDFCSYLLVLVCAIVLARQAARRLPRLAKAMWWAGTAVLLAVAGYGYVELHPRRPDDIIAILGIGGIAGAVSSLVVAVLMAPIWATGDWIRVRFENWRAENRRREEEWKHAEEEKRQAAIRHQLLEDRLKAEEEYRRSRPAPPTRAELADAARHRFEQTIRMLDSANLDASELDGAKQHAKQTYLAELDGLMK